MKEAPYIQVSTCLAIETITNLRDYPQLTDLTASEIWAETNFRPQPGDVIQIGKSMDEDLALVVESCRMVLTNEINVYLDGTNEGDRHLSTRSTYEATTVFLLTGRVDSLVKQLPKEAQEEFHARN